MSCLTSRLRRLAVVLSVAVLSSGGANAQEPLGATARISSRPITQPGVDSGKVFVSIKINGIPEIGLRSLTREQVVLVDAFGRRYTPFGYAIRASRTETKTLLATYLTPPAERLADREYLFLVAQGLNVFEVRVANLNPLRVVALPSRPSR